MPTRSATDLVTGDYHLRLKRPERETLCSPPSSSEAQDELSDNICEHCSICLRGVHRHNFWITSVFFEADRATWLEGVRRNRFRRGCEPQCFDHRYKRCCNGYVSVPNSFVDNVDSNVVQP